MNIVLDQNDFRRLSPRSQREILEHLSGKALAGPEGTKRRERLFWRRPVDLSPDLTVKLVHGLGDIHRKRLEVLARKGGRASVKELLAVSGDTDWHVLSYFQSVLTRRLRRLIDDPEKKAELIKWDFDSTKWDRDRTTIVDGIYYCSKATASALHDVLKPAGGGGTTAAQ